MRSQVFCSVQTFSLQKFDMSIRALIAHAVFLARAMLRALVLLARVIFLALAILLEILLLA